MLSDEGKDTDWFAFCVFDCSCMTSAWRAFVSLCVSLSQLWPQCSLRTLWHSPRSSVQSLHTGGAAEGSLNPHHQRLVRPLPPHPDPGWPPHFTGVVSPTSSSVSVETVNIEHMFNPPPLHHPHPSGALWVTEGADSELDWWWEQHCPLLHDGRS